MSGSYRHGLVTPLLRLSGTTISGIPPRNANVRTWAPIQSGRGWVLVPPVFLPQKGQGDALALEFLVDVRPQGNQAVRDCDDRRRGKQETFQSRGVELGRERPGQPRQGKPAKVLSYGAARYRAATGNLAVRKPAGELESKDFVYLAHGQSNC